MYGAHDAAYTRQSPGFLVLIASKTTTNVSVFQGRYELCAFFSSSILAWADRELLWYQSRTIGNSTFAHPSMILLVFLRVSEFLRLLPATVLCSITRSAIPQSVLKSHPRRGVGCRIYHLSGDWHRNLSSRAVIPSCIRIFYPMFVTQRMKLLPNRGDSCDQRRVTAAGATLTVCNVC